jgi:tetratricopeptide (TPR) repeat protein
LGDGHADTADVRVRLGRVLSHQEDFDSAEEELRKAVAAREELFGADDLQTAEAYSLLGTVLNRKGEYTESQAFHEKALATRLEKLGDNDPLVHFERAAVEAAKDSKPEDEITS